VPSLITFDDPHLALEPRWANTRLGLSIGVREIGRSARPTASSGPSRLLSRTQRPKRQHLNSGLLASLPGLDVYNDGDSDATVTFVPPKFARWPLPSSPRNFGASGWVARPKFSGLLRHHKRGKSCASITWLMFIRKPRSSVLDGAHVRPSVHGPKTDFSNCFHFSCDDSRPWRSIFTRVAIALNGLAPRLFFGPCTLGRTWGTRPRPEDLGWWINS